MLRPAFPRQSLLRISLLVLLAFGMLVKPVLNQMGELHAAEHAAQVVDDHGAPLPDNLDPHDIPDHAKGIHGLMHAADGGTSSVIVSDSTALAVTPSSVERLRPGAAPLPPPPLTSPFRPPIA